MAPIELSLLSTTQVGTFLLKLPAPVSHTVELTGRGPWAVGNPGRPVTSWTINSNEYIKNRFEGDELMNIMQLVAHFWKRSSCAQSRTFF